MGTSSERVFNGSGKGYLPAGTIGNRTHILSERLKAGTEFKRLKKGHRPAPMPLKWTHILSYKPHVGGGGDVHFCEYSAIEGPRIPTFGQKFVPVDAFRE